MIVAEARLPSRGGSKLMIGWLDQRFLQMRGRRSWRLQIGIAACGEARLLSVAVDGGSPIAVGVVAVIVGFTEKGKNVFHVQNLESLISLNQYFN